MRSKIILLVEDNPDDVTLTLRALRKNKLANEVVVASDGAEALDYLFGNGKYAGRDLAKLPQAILLDLKLPKIDGLEVLRSIRQNPKTERIPVIVLTSSPSDQDKIDSYNLGVNSYVQKPVDFNAFIAAVQQLGLYWLVLNELP